MLLGIDKISEGIFVLEISLKGEEYQEALENYYSYIPELFRDSYENELFPKGKTPLVVNEELHGDGLYRYILEARFATLYREAIVSSKIANACLKEIEIVYFSRDQIVVNVRVETTKLSTSVYMSNIEVSSVDTVDPPAVLKKAIDHISNVDKLVISTIVERDKFFWRDLQDVCIAYQQHLTKKLAPILGRIGVLNYGGNAIRIDINDSDPMRSLYPIVELSIFPCAVLSAALHEYIPDFSCEDEQNLKKYIFSTADEIMGFYNQSGENSRQILTNRFDEYNNACRNESLCGVSLYGQFGMDFEGIKRWTQNHQAKCAHILCDYMAYIKHFARLGSFEDLEKLKPIVVKNTESEIKKFMDLFSEMHTTSGAIFMTVRGALNGSRKIKWKAEGLCQYCGREFKKGLFGSKCPVCKIKKDY